MTKRYLVALSLFTCATAASATVAQPGIEVPALGPVGYLALTALVGGVGYLVIRRRPK
jgi:hypothetical protein